MFVFVFVCCLFVVCLCCLGFFLVVFYLVLFKKIKGMRFVFSILKTRVTNSVYPVYVLKQHFKLVFPKQNIDHLRHNIIVAFDVTYKDDVIFTDAPENRLTAYYWEAAIVE